MGQLVDEANDKELEAALTDLKGLVGHFSLLAQRDQQPLIAFDLGCGQHPITKDLGFLGVDYNCKADVQANLFDFPWTFVPDDRVDFFFTSHFIEHIPQDVWDGFWLEAWKKLRVGGYMLNIHPFGNSDRAWQDPDHKQVITHARYGYLSREWREKNGVDHYGAAVNFDIINILEIWNEDFAGIENEEVRAHHRRHTWNAIDDLASVLRKAE